jgi:tetratricopeptide (TPR) repeat protein
MTTSISITAATALMAEAATYRRRRFFGLFPPTAYSVDTAGRTYMRAASAYKASKSWDHAANAYRLAADCFMAIRRYEANQTAHAEHIRMLINNRQMEEANTQMDLLNRNIYANGGHATLGILIYDVAPIVEKSHPAIAASFYRMGIAASNATSHYVRAGELTKGLARLLASQGQYAEAAALLEAMVRDSGSSSSLIRSYGPEVVILTRAAGLPADAKLTELLALDKTVFATSMWDLARQVVHAATASDFNRVLEYPMEPWLSSVIRHIQSITPSAATA